MSNLLWLVHGGLGERDKPGAPTFWKTVEGYIAAGWRIFVVDIGSNTDTPLGKRDYGDGLYIIRFNPPFLKIARIHYFGVIFHLLQSVWIRWKLEREAQKLIDSQKLTGRDTVVYGMEISATRAAYNVSRKNGMRLVTRYYGVWDMYDLPDTPRNHWSRYPAFEAYRTEADRIIITNDGTNGDKLLKRLENPSPYVFWRNGVDLAPDNGAEAELIPDFPDGTKVLMTLSRLYSEKRIDRAIDAMPVVLEKHPEARLVICGYGEERESLERRAEERHVADKVFFTGRIDHEKIYAYLKKADVFLSLFDVSNLGNPIFEAMRAGRAIVTLDVGDTASVIQNGENGILLPNGDPDTIAKAVIRLLDDPSQIKRLGDAAEEYARENFWTWEERIAAEIQEVSALLPGDNDC